MTNIIPVFELKAEWAEKWNHVLAQDNEPKALNTLASSSLSSILIIKLIKIKNTFMQKYTMFSLC